MARVRLDNDGTVAYVTQSDVDSIAYAVYDRGAAVGAGGTLDAADTVYDALQTGTTWVEAIDATGGNFSFRLDGTTYLPLANRKYAVVVTFTLGDVDSFVEWNLVTVSPRG